jgi:hypothetical protein
MAKLTSTDIYGSLLVQGTLLSNNTLTGTRLISTVATGTAPLTVASNTLVTNLNADLLDGQDGSYYLNYNNFTNVPSTFAPSAHAITSHTATAWRMFFSNATTTAIQELAFGNAATYLRSGGATSNPTWATISYSELSGTPTIGDGTLSWGTASAGSTNTTVAGSLSGAYSANTTNNRTLNLAIGPALTNLASTMTGTGSGFLRKNGADTYTLDTNTYLTSYTETQTLQDVTTLGATTSTAISITNNTASTTTGTGALLVTGGVGIGGNVNIGGNLSIAGNITVKDVEMISTSNGIIFEGSTNDNNETTLIAVDPTADRTISLPNLSGTVALTSDLHNRSHTMTSTSDHTAGNWRVFHSNGSGQVVELALGAAATYLRSAGASAAPTFSQIAYSELSGTPTIPTGFTISAGATDGIFDITGTGGTNSVSYSFAPYAAKQTSLQHFYLGTTNPTVTTRLNLDAALYATQLYDGGNRVYTSANLPAYPTGFTISAGATDGIFDITGTGGTNSVSYSFAPYAAQQALLSFDTSTSNPSRTDRLNLNGILHATRFISTVATGTAPFGVTSTTKVDNLNADLLDGLDSTAFYLASNPSGYTNNAGTVTSVASGAGMNFTTITGSGTVTMGTPSSLTDVTTNSASGTTHTHAITNFALSGTANVISVSGTPKVLGSASTLNLITGHGDTVNPYGSKTANTFLAAPNGTNGSPTFRAIVAADIPTLNQNTTGSAGSVASSLVLKFDAGTTEGTDLYTFNGSAAKTIDFKSGTNVTITEAAGTATFSSPSLSLGTTSGSGNAVTDISVSGHQITMTKGATFLTSYTETDTLATVTGRGATTATAISLTNATASTTTSTGALVVTGGVGIGGALNVGGAISTDSNLSMRAAATASVATQIPVFIADPASTTRTLVTRTPAQLRSDIGAQVAGSYLTAEADTLATVTGRGNTTATAVSFTNNTASTSTSTGAVTITGGLGVGGSAHIGGNLTVTGNITVNNVEMISTSNGIIFEGSTNDDFETTLTAINPTADRTISLPNASGTVALTSDLHSRSHTMTSTSDHTAGNWQVFYSNASGNVVELPLGTAGQVLKSNGATAAPSWQADNDTVYTHPTFSRSDTTSSVSPAFGGTFTAVDSVTSNNGHVTAINLKTVTIPTPSYPTVNNGTLTLAVSGTGLSGSASFTANQSGNSTFTVASNATDANTNSTIVARNSSGNFSATNIGLTGGITVGSATPSGTDSGTMRYNSTTKSIEFIFA